MIVSKEYSTDTILPVQEKAKKAMATREAFFKGKKQ